MRRWIKVGLVLLLLGGVAGGVVAQTWPADPVLHVVTVGQNPTIVAIDGQTSRAFIANTNSDSVSVLDTGTGRLLRTVEVGSLPGDIAVDERTGRVFVANDGTDSTTVSMLDARSGVVLRTIRVGAAPTGVVADTQTSQVFVSALFGQSVTVLDALSGRILRTIKMDGQYLDAVALDARTGRLFTLTADHAMVLAAHSGRVLRSITVGVLPLAVASDPQTGHAFVTGHIPNSTSDIVAMLDASSGRLLRRIDVGRNPGLVKVDVRQGRLFVVNEDDGTLSVIATSTGATVRTIAATSPFNSAQVPAGVRPFDLAVDARRNRVFVINRESNSMSMLDARRGTVLRTLHLDVNPQAVGVDELRGHIVVATAGGVVSEPGIWGWIPSGLRRWLPFVASGASMRRVPPRAIVLDESRLS